MPKYNYQCGKCGDVEEKYNTIADRKRGGKCKKCSNKREYVFRAIGCNVSKFKPVDIENLDIEPVHVTSRSQLKEECKKRGVMSAYLM